MQNGISDLATRLSAKERMDKALKDMEELASEYGFKIEEFDK